MDFRKITRVLAVFFAILLCACSKAPEQEIMPVKPDGHYATQYRMSTVEYSIFMNTQLVNFASLVQGRMVATSQANPIEDSREAEMTRSALGTMREIKDGVEAAYPSKGRDDDREDVLEAMDAAIGDMERYLKAVEGGISEGERQSYNGIFLNDFNTLTAFADVYH